MRLDMSMKEMFQGEKPKYKKRALQNRNIQLCRGRWRIQKRKSKTNKNTDNSTKSLLVQLLCNLSYRVSVPEEVTRIKWQIRKFFSAHSRLFKAEEERIKVTLLSSLVLLQEKYPSTWVFYSSHFLPMYFSNYTRFLFYDSSTTWSRIIYFFFTPSSSIRFIELL